MAVTFNNFTTTAGPASVGTKTLIFTATAGSCLLVWTHANTSVSISGIQANNVALTRLGHVSASSSRAEVWGLTAPPSGVLSISANTVAAASLNFCMVATGYVGHERINSPFGTVAVGTATGATANLSVSSTSTDLVAFGFGISANLAITLNNGTSRADTTISTSGRLVVGDITGASTVSLSATANGAGTVWAMLGVPIVAAVTPLAFDNAAFTATQVSANTNGMLLTATVGAVLLVFVGVGGADTVSAVNVGTIQLTQLAGITYSAGTNARRAELWGLTAPASGTLTISAALVGAASNPIAIGAVTYTGHRTTATPFGGVVTNTASTGATNNIIVSSTVGNVVVIGWNTASGNVSSMPTTVNRLVTQGNFPAITVADARGASNYTASATRAAVTSWGNIGLNLIASSGPATISAIAAMTDLTDTFSASAANQITGVFAKTDNPDKFTASTSVIIRGTFAATDVVDKFTAVAATRITGIMALTTPTDTFAATAATRITSTFAATDAPDRFTAIAALRITGLMSATDVADRFTSIEATRITGLFAATDVVDKFTAVAATRITAAFAATDIRDTFAATAANRITGILAATDTPDHFSASGTTAASFITGNFIATDAPDKLTAVAAVRIASSFVATDPADTLAASVTTVAPSPAPAPSPSPAPSSSAGGGGRTSRKPAYIPANRDFWEARERYLISLQPEITAELPLPIAEPEPTPDAPAPVSAPRRITALHTERAEVISLLPLAESMRQLRTAGERLRTINSAIRAEAEARRRRVQHRTAIKRKLLQKVALAAARATLWQSLTSVIYSQRQTNVK